MELPLVTICVPNFNKEKFVERTLFSVFKQTYNNIELIVIDDCSTDSSEEKIIDVLKKCPFNFQYFKNEINRGVCYTSNRGLKAASGKYFQILSSDDVILPFKIAHQVNILEKSSTNDAFIFSPIKIIDEDDNVAVIDYYKKIGYNTTPIPSGNIYKNLLEINFIPAPSLLIKTELIKNVGGFDETLHIEDWEMSLLLSRKFHVLYDETVTAHYRVEKNSLMHSEKSKVLIFDSLCKTLTKHTYQSKEFDKIIFKNISWFAMILYVYEGKTAKYWLVKSIFYSFSFKKTFYTLLASLGIKYKVIKRWK